MCGITGIFKSHFQSQNELASKARLMSKTLKFRGPDGEGVWVSEEDGLAFGHRRLAILDISERGKQPMKSLSGRYIITFNGEIYNHLELRNKLACESGCHFQWRGHSDTETLLACFEVWGLKKTLKSITGMFAIALWDASDKQLYLVRDRFGEKPLYWGFIREGGTKSFVFSSEILPIQAIADAGSLKISNKAKSLYDFFGYIPAPHSVYKGIFQLAPGTILHYRGDFRDPTINEWWNTLREETKATSTRGSGSQLRSNLTEAKDSVKAALVKSIRLQQIADVPLGSFLSGGIDSSLVTSILSHCSTAQVRTFTVSFPDSDLNEGPFSQAVADYLGTDHTEIAMTSADALSVIPQIASMFSEPFSDSSQVPTFMVCQAARLSGLRVALTGDGADELFGGYTRHRLIPRIHRIFGPLSYSTRLVIASLLESPRLSRNGRVSLGRRKLAEIVRSASNPNIMYSALLSSQIRSKLLDLESLPNSATLEESLMLADLVFYMNNDVLTKVDRCSMRASLETRAPFLNQDLARLAWSLPKKMKINGSGKLILKEVLSDFLPKNLFTRPKSGFAMPIGDWLRGPLKTWAEEILLTQDRSYCYPEDSIHLKNAWYSHLAGVDQTPYIWSALMWRGWEQMVDKCPK